MARRTLPIDESEFRADLWAGLRARANEAPLQEALKLLRDGALERLPCLPVLWEHAHSLHLSEVQLDLVWLHWLIDQCKCPFALDREVTGATARAEKLRALLRQAVFPQLGVRDEPSYSCSAERRAKWETLFRDMSTGKARLLPFSRRMRWVLDDMEKPKGQEGWPYNPEIAEAAKRAKTRRADPVGLWVEESVGQFGVAEEFFAAGANDRVALVQRLLQPDLPPAGFARLEALPETVQ